MAKNLKRETRIVESGNALWQKVIVSFVELIDYFWKNFPDKEKTHFISKYITFMQRYTSSFPVENAKKMIEMLDKGILSIRGGLKSIKYINGKMEATFLDGEVERREEFDFVIDASGQEKNLLKSGEGLYGCLAEIGASSTGLVVKPL